jgi:HD-GYP domain-containing protein (c-di-GMP phosphodiesterase class II)
MVVARTLYGNGGQVLLRSGVTLTSSYLAQLRELRVPALYIDDGLMPEYVVDDVISENTRMNAMDQVRQIVSEAEHPTSKQVVVMRSKQIAKTMESILDELLAKPDLMVNLVDIRLEDDYLFAHSVNVCVLSLITGIRRSLSRDSLMQLGLGAMLHDIGKVVMPRSILHKPGSLTPQEYEIIKTHTTEGYAMLAELCGARDIAHEHHERFDGTGYPQHKKGAEIRISSQVAGICDVFDAVTADRVYRQAHPVSEAFELLAGSGNRSFDLQLIKDFLYNIAAYPTGTVVELSDGRIAICLDTRPGASLYPRVRLLYDQERRPVAGSDEMDLSTTYTITIKRVVSEGEVDLFRSTRLLNTAT